jgi:hypothetical protein
MSVGSISVLSTEYVKVSVAQSVSGAVYNPTADTVQFAFLTSQTANPATNDWVTGSWETAGTRYYARCLLGPGAGGHPLAVGTYFVWLKITDSPEVPVRDVGTLRVY